MRARFLLSLLIVLAAAFAPLPAAAGPGSSAPAVVTLWTAPLGSELSVTRRFDPPPDPYAAGHRGVDLGGTPGSPVLAAGDGVVAFAGMVAGRPVVSIDHADGLRTTYEPVDPSVAAGQRVARGSPIGALLTGHAGCPREACLHWGLRRGATYLDPMLLLRPPRVRLLPMGEVAAVSRRPIRPARASRGPARPPARPGAGRAVPRRGERVLRRRARAGSSARCGP
jgi:murein DD-endopeptidase MepM/ murein hydrolase activator NlpD